MPRFETITVPISLGSNELNPINAYFLGAILSADEPQIDNGKKIWLAPYRHNYGGTANDSNIGVHIKFVKSLIKRCNGKILLKKRLQIAVITELIHRCGNHISRPLDQQSQKQNTEQSR